MGFLCYNDERYLHLIIIYRLDIKLCEDCLWWIYRCELQIAKPYDIDMIYHISLSIRFEFMMELDNH